MKQISLVLILVLLPTLLGSKEKSLKELQDEDVDSLIKRVDKISLSRIVSAVYIDGAVIYTYKVLENLKGDVRDGAIVGVPLAQGVDFLRDFKRHQDPNFWKKHGGRMQADKSGRIKPSFDVGSVYVIFHDRPYHRKSFEYIQIHRGDRKRQDKWLNYIRDHVKKK